MKTKALAFTVLAMTVVTGCSTKNYGRQPELTSFEKQTMSCREIDLETAKVNGFLTHVREESEFDGRSVLSFLGDFGIGNLLERDAAIDSANKRLIQLSEARSMCQNVGYEESQPARTVNNVGNSRSKESQLQELQNTQGISYEEYQRRYRMIMDQ